MVKFTPEFVKKLNEESDGMYDIYFDEFLAKHGLNILPEYKHKQVVGIEDNMFLIFDEEVWGNYEDGFILMTVEEYVKEALDDLERYEGYDFEGHKLTLTDLKEIWANKHKNDYDEPPNMY